MTFELKQIINAFTVAEKKGIKTVMATVVALEGSSYRRPGVRMLIREDGKMIGAVSGGCVEKEVFRQALGVFADNTPRMMTYDGRYRLGCEGILYILIEPFRPPAAFMDAFSESIRLRNNINVKAYYVKDEGKNEYLGSVFGFGKDVFSLGKSALERESMALFEQLMQPCFKLMIIGAEHDAVQLCSFAALTGWEVDVVAAAAEQKTIKDFPGARQFSAVEPEFLEIATIDSHTAVILMTHSYVRDLKYLLAIIDSRPSYLGLLGPAKRREKLLGELMERHPELPDDFFDGIHGPAGLSIGAETAQEIAISILAEILSVIRKEKPISLKNKKGGIHS